MFLPVRMGRLPGPGQGAQQRTRARQAAEASLPDPVTFR